MDNEGRLNSRKLMRQRPATTEQLRSAIDRGLTGDKINSPDPAAAPLGTDDEAAGTATPPSATADALQYETARPATRSEGKKKKSPLMATALTIAVFAGLALVLLATLLRL